MVMELKRQNKRQHLYMEVYDYYRQQIQEGKLPAGSRMPSLRKCAGELRLSRTTVENAYLQLAADGYIAAKPQSGYYVTERAARAVKKAEDQKSPPVPVRYPFAPGGADRESFRFDLWRRYVKSALREDDRLLSYGEPQGEYELREALAAYVRESRNILCTPEDIVIGAGTQSLLQILCPLLKNKRTVSIPNASFVQSAAVFTDYGFDVRYRNKESDVIYVSPAHMTKWGEIMPVKRRLELAAHAKNGARLIIEDDYENEFVYSQKPTPSLFGLDGGAHVVYFGSFSRLLLPSIRISFMILPPGLKEAYQKKRTHYNQTASKTEQIALCQFIRDGHLAAQTRRLKRLYAQKRKALTEAVQSVFGKDCRMNLGIAGTSLALELPWKGGGRVLQKQLSEKGVSLEILQKTDDSVTAVLSCASMPEEDFIPACWALAQAINR